MSEKIPQMFANHGRFDPWFHFFALPVLAITMIAALVNAVRHPGLHSVWMVLVAAAVFVTLAKARTYALKVQDRVIRLEERMRLAALSPALHPRIVELSERQLIALRFASDQEVAALAERALNEKLDPKDIKKAVRNWRPDYWRV